jgi:chemotaxis protein CheX
MDVRYINPFIVSCRLVFDRMIHVPVVLGKPYLRRNSGPHMAVSVIMGFGGSVTGCVVMRLSQKVSLALASGILQTPQTAIDADGIDALGEIANMIAGAAKKDLPGGLATLSIPSVILGDHGVNYPSGVPIIAIPCETDAGPFLLEIAVQPVPASVPDAPARVAEKVQA